MPVGGRAPARPRAASDSHAAVPAKADSDDSAVRYEGRRPYQMGSLGAAGQKTPRKPPAQVPNLRFGAQQTEDTPERGSSAKSPHRRRDSDCSLGTDFQRKVHTPRTGSLLDSIPRTPGSTSRWREQRAKAEAAPPKGSSNLNDWMLRMRGCPLVRKLDVTKGVQQGNMRQLVDRVKWEGNELEEEVSAVLLAMTSSKLRVAECHALAQLLRFNTTVTHVNLSDAGITDFGGQHLATAIRVNKSIVKLELKGNLIGAMGAESLAAALVENQALQTLDLHGNPLGPQGARAIGEALMTNRTLLEVNLRLCRILDDGCRRVADALKVNRTLTALNLTGNEIGDGGGWALADAIKSNRALTSLIICSNTIHGDSAPALADALFEHPTLKMFNLIPLEYLRDGLLKKLDCSYRQCGSPGVQVVAQLIRRSTQLFEVDLRNNDLNDLDVRALMNAVGENESLLSLDLRGNPRQKLIPPEVVDSGGTAVVALLRSMLQKPDPGEEPRLKWAFLGRGECGKTAFVHGLKDAKGETEFQATVQCEITDGYRPSFSTNKFPCQVSLWDFGGQGAYWRGTNQTFLTERRTIYFLCFDISYSRPELLQPPPDDPREPKPPWGEMEEMAWLRMFVNILLAHVPRAVVQLVGLKADLVEDGEERARRLALAAKVFENAVADHQKQLELHLEALRVTPGSVEEIGLTYEDASEQQLQHAIVQLEKRIKYRMVLTTPPAAVSSADKDAPRTVLANVESFLSNARQFPDFRNIYDSKWRALVDLLEKRRGGAGGEEGVTRRMLTWNEFYEMGLDAGYEGGADLDDAVDLMHGCGMVMHFARDPVLRQLVVIDSEWLLETVIRPIVRHDYSRLIRGSDNETLRRVKTLKAFGVLDALLLEAMWQDQDPSEYHDLFRLMVKFDVIIPFSRRTALFPLQLPPHPDSEVKRMWRSTVKRTELIVGGCIDMCPVPCGFFSKLLCRIWPVVQIQKAWLSEKTKGMPAGVNAGCLATSRRSEARILIQMLGDSLLVMARHTREASLDGPGRTDRELELELAVDTRGIFDRARQLLDIWYHGSIYEVHAVCPHCLLQPQGAAVNPAVADRVLTLNKDSKVFECLECGAEKSPGSRMWDAIAGNIGRHEIPYEVFLSLRPTRNRHLGVDIQERLRDHLITPFWEQGGQGAVSEVLASRIPEKQRHATLVRAMAQSFVFVPIICRSTLIDMEKMTEDSFDQMLLDFILASELQRSGNTQVVVPLLVGAGYAAEVTKYIKDVAQNKLPAVVPYKVLDVAADILASIGIYSNPEIRTVKQIVEDTMTSSLAVVLPHVHGAPVGAQMRKLVESFETMVKEVRLCRFAGGVIVGTASEREYIDKRSIEKGAQVIKLDLNVATNFNRNFFHGRTHSQRETAEKGEPATPQSAAAGAAEDTRLNSEIRAPGGGDRPCWGADAYGELAMGVGIELRPNPPGIFEIIVREMLSSGMFEALRSYYQALEGGVTGEVEGAMAFSVRRSTARLLLKQDGNALTIVARCVTREGADHEAAVAVRAAANIVDDVLKQRAVVLFPINFDLLIMCTKCLSHTKGVLDPRIPYDKMADVVGMWDQYGFHSTLKQGAVAECLACHRKLMSSAAYDVLDPETPVSLGCGKVDVIMHYHQPVGAANQLALVEEMFTQLEKLPEVQSRLCVRLDGTAPDHAVMGEVIALLSTSAVFIAVTSNDVIKAAAGTEGMEGLLPLVVGLELLEAGKIQAVVPVLIDGAMPAPEKLPAAQLPPALMDRARAALAAAGVMEGNVFPKRELPKPRTVQELARDLTKCQALSFPASAADKAHEDLGLFCNLLRSHIGGVVQVALRTMADWHVKQHKSIHLAKYREAEEAARARRDGDDDPQTPQSGKSPRRRSATTPRGGDKGKGGKGGRRSSTGRALVGGGQ